MKTTKFRASVSILRPSTSIIAGLVAAAVYWSTAVTPVISGVFQLFLTVFLTSGYGFVLNDYFDLEKDRLQHKNRILPKGLLSPPTAYRLALTIGIISLLLSANISSKVFLLNLLTLALLGIYSFINNRNGILANIVTAINSSFVLLIGMVAGRYTPLILWLSLATFLLILGREIILDIRDMVGDRAISKTSIPIIYGITNSFLISGLLFLLSSFVLSVLALFCGNIWFSVFVGAILNITLWFSFLYFSIIRSDRSWIVFVGSTRLSFLLLLPGILL